MSDFADSPEFYEAGFTPESAERVSDIILRGVVAMQTRLGGNHIGLFYTGNFAKMPPEFAQTLRQYGLMFKSYGTEDGVLHPDAHCIEIGITFGRFLAATTMHSEPGEVRLLEEEIMGELRARLVEPNQRFDYDDWIRMLGADAGWRLNQLFPSKVLDFLEGDAPYIDDLRQLVFAGAGYVFAKMERRLIELQMSNFNKPNLVESACIRYDLVRLEATTEVTLADFGVPEE